jgi:hypothetical protein
MSERKMLDAQKIQSHIISLKAIANTMLAEAEKLEQMLEKKPSKKQMELETLRASAILAYEKRFQRRLKKD